MKNVYLVAVLVALHLVVACTSVNPVSSDVPVEAESDVPQQIGSFSYVGKHVYPDKKLGYQLRYAQDDNAYADVYIYPVPEVLSNVTHKDKVYEMTGAAIGEIIYMTEHGAYSNFEILDERVQEIDGRITARIDGRFIKDESPAYTLIILTEHLGTILKIRMTMPDSAQNRDSQDWTSFADNVFLYLIEDMESSK